MYSPKVCKVIVFVCLPHGMQQSRIQKLMQRLQEQLSRRTGRSYMSYCASAQNTVMVVYSTSEHVCSLLQCKIAMLFTLTC